MPRSKKFLQENCEEKERLEEMRRQQRLVEAQKARERRANQTPEEIAARRMRDAQRARERRARLTPEQIAQQRLRDAILKRERRAKESEAEKAIRRSLEAQKARERRAKLMGRKQTVTSICTAAAAAAARMGLSHFMDLAERTDLRCDQNVNDPLSAPTEWVNPTTYIELQSLDPYA